MWEKGVFSMDTSTGLSNAVFFYNCKVFGLRGGKEHIGLLAEQFHFGHDDINAVFFYNCKVFGLR